MKTRKTLLKLTTSTLFACALFATSTALADEYQIDKKGAHAFIQFKISHLGYSWLWGRFNDFDGTFTYDEKDPSASKTAVTIKTASVDSNHAERDKHLRNEDFLEVDKYPEAKFVSTKYTDKGDGKASLTGNFTLRGITKEIVIDVTHIGAGDDPWGGYRRGFEGKTRIALADYGIKKDLGPASAELDIILSVEGIKK